MKRQWYIALLLALCVTIIILQVSGGFAETIQTIQHVTPGTIVMPGTRALIIDILAFCAWIWGMVITARARQWKWFWLVFLTCYLGGCIYASFILLSRGKRQRGEEKPTLATE
jgi:hypothetical protein